MSKVMVTAEGAEKLHIALTALNDLTKALGLEYELTGEIRLSADGGAVANFQSVDDFTWVAELLPHEPVRAAEPQIQRINDTVDSFRTAVEEGRIGPATRRY